MTSNEGGIADPASGTVRCGNGAAQVEGTETPQTVEGGAEELCTLAVVAHLQPHGSMLVLEQRRRVLAASLQGRDSSQLLLHLLSVPPQVTFLLGFCLYLCLVDALGCSSKSTMSDSLFPLNPLVGVVPVSPLTSEDLGARQCFAVPRPQLKGRVHGRSSVASGCLRAWWLPLGQKPEAHFFHVAMYIFWNQLASDKCRAKKKNHSNHCTSCSHWVPI